MNFVWVTLIALALVWQYLVVSLSLLALVAVLLVSKRVRLPQKLAQASLCLMIGTIAGAIWFISHTDNSDFFPMQD